MSFRNYYDSTYGRTRGDSSIGRSTSTDRPASVTAKYITTTPSYKTSSIPIRRERSASREQNESPITAIANKYASYKLSKDDKAGLKYSDKKDSYNKLTVPTLTTNKSRDVSPVSTSSKYSLNRSSRHLSPDRRIMTSSSLTKGRSRDPSPSDRDKDIPNKTDKSSSYNSLSSYKLYPRASTYTRPSSRSENKPEITVNRYAIANRISTNYLRSPSIEKSSRTSVSPINHSDSSKSDAERATNSKADNNVVTNSFNNNNAFEEIIPSTRKPVENGNSELDDDVPETITVITRHTSPTPPGNSAYIRIRRADMAKTLEKTITRPKKKPEMVDKEIQSDRLDDTTRASRFASTARTSVSNWSSYTPTFNHYTGYAGRYSTAYGSTRETPVNNCYNEKNINNNTYPENNQENLLYKDTEITEPNNVENNEFHVQSTSADNKPVIFNTITETNDDDDTSEIIINVNLKLKKATTTELVSPEITITNSQLPPQAPKLEGTITKVKKLKVRKSSTDSSSDSSSKKKIVKKRSKSVSSTESEQGSDSKSGSKSPESSPSPPKALPRNSSSSNVKSNLKQKNISSRDSNSPESITTLSTQSSLSEDESITKSKTVDLSRTSADDVSISLDKSNKHQSLPASPRNEGTEEAKSFLIRALGPVTNLFKIRTPESSDSHWLETSTSESTSRDVSNLITESDKISKSNTDNIIASNSDNVVKLKRITPINSEENHNWIGNDKSSSSLHIKQKSPSDKNLNVKIKHVESGERAWWLESNSDSKCNNQNKVLTDTFEANKSSKSGKFGNFDSEEKPWWLDSCANIPEGIQCLTPPRKVSSDSEKSEKFDFYKVRHNDSGDKDWWLTSNDNSSGNKDSKSCEISKSASDHRSFPLRRIRHVESGERPWWLSSSKNIPEGVEKLPTPPPRDSDSSDSEEVEIYASKQPIPPFPLSLPDDEPLGDRRSPEGLETPRETENCRDRNSQYENSNRYGRNRQDHFNKENVEKFISRYTDIDDILGTSGQMYSPFMDLMLARRAGETFDEDMSECEEIDPTQVRIHDSTAKRPVIQKLRCRSEIVDYQEENQIDDAALQVFKDGDYGPYLDLDSTIREQEEELSGVQESRKNAIVLRTQLSVRVHAIIERLLHSQGRELRKALFTFKQILQADKDLVHEFVASNGLDCLMQVGAKADHNYLDYILRALGQILLYVDGMHGVMAHETCIQWLYSLISSKFRHVVKTTLKLLLVFVEYTEKNCLLLIEAIKVVDEANGNQPWHNIMKILQDIDASDTELLIYATNLINRCLNNIPHRESYYEQVNALRNQGMDEIIQIYMAKQGTDLDLLRQLQIFEAVLLYENDDESGNTINQLDGSFVSPRRRRSPNCISERRKSTRQQSNDNAFETQPKPEIKLPTINYAKVIPPIREYKETSELSEALRRRRSRFQAEDDNSLNVNNNDRSVYENGSHSLKIGMFANGNVINSTKGHKTDTKEENYINNKMNKLNIAETGVQYTSGLMNRIQNGTLGHSVTAIDALAAARQNGAPEVKEERLTNTNTKEIAQRLTSPVSATTEDKIPKVGDMVVGIVSKAKEELAKSQSKEIIKSPTKELVPKVHEIKRSENDLHWEALEKDCLKRKFYLCDLDFSDLQHDSDEDVSSFAKSSGVPPPPPSMFLLGGAPPPPPSSLRLNIPAPPPKSVDVTNNSDNSSSIKKNKKTVKLFWREVQEFPIPAPMKEKVGGFIWDDLPNVDLDTKMLEHLFESKSNDLIIKKLAEPKRNVILSAKRSNAINIAMKKLPAAQTIKAAIMKMDATIIGREGIEKLLTMLPTQEEIIKIEGAQYANPDLPLGSAEQFLLTLASISELSSRLKLWVFKLDFDNLEKEIAEPLMDLKQSTEQLKVNKTFKSILSVLRTVGSFLNGSQVKGFRLEYLSKVIEVKDTVHKHPLLYHICEMVIEKFPDSTDFYSEVGPVLRASKVDFQALCANISRLEADCKASWDHMKCVAKHDSSHVLKTKINEFLTDAAQRIILLNFIQKKVMIRYNKFLLYLGVPPSDLANTNPSVFLKIISEFALEYRTTRERVLLKNSHRERNKTRGKMIVDVGTISTKISVDDADSALKEILKTDADSQVRAGRKKPNKSSLINSELTADDDFIENLVKSATTKRRPAARKRPRLSEHINLNRTLDGNQSWPGKNTNSNGAVNNGQ